MDFNVASSNPNSKLIKDQELNIAYNRGEQTPEDVSNLKYAIDKGWYPTSPLIPTVTNISQGTNEIEDETKKLEGDISIEDGKDANKDINTIFSDIESKYKNLNNNTDQELRDIESAGTAAGSAYDTLISTAMEDKRQGMAKDLIRAGEKGGFMSTQQAGLSALVPTEGGNWYGAGGNLERQKSVYDNKITELQRLRVDAIFNAKAAARKAIKTGKLEDIQAGKDMLDMARNIANDMKQAEIDKANLELKKTDTAWNIMKDLGEGQSVDINGVKYTGAKQAKPFFTSSEITQIMLKLNKGESTTLTDPNTGEDITITGILDQAEKTTTLVDDKGYAHVINTQTGKEIAKSATPVGKTKTQAANVSIMMNDQEKGDLSGAVARLTGTMGDKFNTGDVVKEVRTYNTLHPGKGQQLLDTIKADVNMNDSEIKALYSSGIPDTSDQESEIILPSGARINL